MDLLVHQLVPYQCLDGFQKAIDNETYTIATMNCTIFQIRGRANPILALGASADAGMTEHKSKKFK